MDQHCHVGLGVQLVQTQAQVRNQLPMQLQGIKKYFYFLSWLRIRSIRVSFPFNRWIPSSEAEFDFFQKV